MTCLIFRLLDKLYGVDAQVVQEVIPLPEVTPIEEAPPHVIGVINLRGQVIPVLDLHVRLGCVSAPCLIGDAIVVLQVQGQFLGVVISEVLDVRVLSGAAIEHPLDLGDQGNRTDPRVIAGVAQSGDDLIMLLRPENLLSAWDETMVDAPNEGTGGLADRRVFRPLTTSGEREILRKRARQLRAFQERRDGGGMPLAIVSLDGELLGVDLAIVLEFAPLRSVTPIPCAPGHILGDMNLRGEILTLVELGQVLGMSLSNNKGKVLVVGWEGIKLGIPVQDVEDVIRLSPEEIAAPPARIGFLDREHLRGVASYGERMVGIVDLKKILSHEELLVHETV